MSKISSDDRRATWVLLGITLAGGLLRFAWLDHPCLWGDEALVYWRTCGTYGEMLQPLHADGFPPLHYELFWLIVHLLGHTPGPAAMRATAAVCGTLLVPAVYFLARQMVAQRAALTGAAFTAGSAFALFYSRDAKMYGEAWLTMTVSVACLLWWLRTGRSTAWLGWVAAGAAAGGFQTLALVSVTGLAPLLLLTQRRSHWRQTLLCLAGIAVIVMGPAGYYARFNSWTANVDDNGWNASGIQWVQWYNFGRSGPDQLRYLTTSFLTGWEWPRLANAAAPIWPSTAPPRDPTLIHWSVSFVDMPLRRAWWLSLSAAAVLLIVASGGLPWRAARDLIRRLRRRSDPGGLPLDPGLTATTDSQASGTEPPWRAALWLTAWIGLPVYGFYFRSMADFASPNDVLRLADHWHAWTVVGAAVAGGLLVGSVYRPTRSTAVRWAQLCLVFVGLVAVCQGMAVGMASAARAAAADGREWQSVWMPRYLGFVWPALAVVVGVLLDRLPTRAVRLSALAVVLAANGGMFAFRMRATTEPPVDRMAADVWAAQPSADGRPSATLTWTHLTDHSQSQTGPGEGSLFSDPGRYYLQVLAHRPMSPALFKQSLGTFTIHRDDPDLGVPHAIGPDVQRVIVWEQFKDPPSGADKLLPRLPGWERTGDESYSVRDVWTVQDRARGLYRRREYQRLPATRP